MGSNLPYLKGVRTRYINILKKETKCALEILSYDVVLFDETELILKINNCVEKLQFYCDKVENQTDKLAEAIGDSDKELSEQLVTENESICDKAIECVLNLKQMKDEISQNKAKEADVKEKVRMTHIVELQKQMNAIVVDQMRQQHDFLEKQDKKEKELATTVKLPKIDIMPFSGNKLKWTEFWDSFECSIHRNKKLSNIEKFNYLKSKVTGDAQKAISGLALSNENYIIAIDILKDRFGDSQEVINLHYNQMINLPHASSSTSSLRNLLDNMERHLRSLEVLKQNVNQDVFVSMIRAKLPQEVLLQLEIMHGAKNKWTVDALRRTLHEYITAREHADKQDSSQDTRQLRSNQPRYEGKPKFGPSTNWRNGANDWSGAQNRSNSTDKGATGGFGGAKQNTVGSAEALVTSTKQHSAIRYFDQCRYCDKRHWSDECPTYRTIEDRKKQLKDSCFKCLKSGHLSKDCKKNKSCVYCGQVNSHHRSLCPRKFQAKLFSTHLSNEISGCNEVSEVEICEGENALVSSGEMVLMQTAQAKVTNLNQSKVEQVRILLDSGSQRTYITEGLAEQLQLRREKTEEIKLVTFGCETPKTVKTTQTKLNIQLNTGQPLEVSANIVPFISGSVQRTALNLYSSENLVHLMKSLDMADSVPSYTESSTVELLIGSDFYLDIILSQKIEVQPGLYLLASKLGWILTGRTKATETSVKESSMLTLTYGNNITETEVFTAVDSVIPTKPDLEDFWNIEAIGILDDASTKHDDVVKKHFKETLTFEDSRYQVTWPWRDDTVDLPVNRELALGRLKSVVTRMRDKAEVMGTYDSIIKDQLEKGVIEKVNNPETTNIVHYLPHHAVINPLKPTTKLRIVYDASAKTRKENKSLNECLYRGPVMLNDLCGLLMRFRLRTVAVVADIEKAFLQIGLQPTERDVTRFLWLKDHQQLRVDSDNIQEYRFCRVPFGIITSPFLLEATVECHLDSYESELAEKLKRDIYVDNLITGTDSVEEAVSLYHGAKNIFKEASMNLREWVTNNETVNQFIPFSDRATCDSVKVLGHTWSVEQDTISLKNPSTVVSKIPTKRSVLKQVASVFDPMGLLSPVLLKGKIFIQSLWNKNLDWDDALSSEDISVWNAVSSDLSKLPEHQISRCIALNENVNTGRYILLCFCDASTHAYAATVYL